MPETIYKHEKDFKRLFKERVTSSKELSESNKRLLIDFFDALKGEGISFGRRLKYLNFMPNIIKWLGTDFDKAEVRDLIRLAGTIREQAYTEQTKKDYLVSVKKLYKTISILPEYKHLDKTYFWLYDRRNKYFLTSLDMSKIKTKEQWFNEDDVKLILESTNNPRDKALLSILATQGTRPQEVLTLRKTDIQPIENGVVIKVSGKTGVRDVFVYEGFVITAINEYAKSIPKDQEYLFEIGLARANHILKDICKKTGINKTANLYRLRKFAVTRDRVAGLSSGAMEQKYGWKKGTKVIGHYDKSIGIDYQREMMKRYGLIKDETPESKIADKICVRCDTRNTFDKTHCQSCALDLNTTREQLTQNMTGMESQLKALTERMDYVDKIFSRIAKNSKLKEEIKTSLRTA